MHFESFTSSNMESVSLALPQQFFSSISICAWYSLLQIWHTLGCSLTWPSPRQWFFRGWKKNSASWDYLLLSQSITLSNWICHLSKSPEAICFVCNKSPSEGPICLLFSVIPATFLSCALFFLGFTLIISDWIVHLLCTYLLLVFTIF